MFSSIDNFYFLWLISNALVPARGLKHSLGSAQLEGAYEGGIFFVIVTTQVVRAKAASEIFEDTVRKKSKALATTIKRIPKPERDGFLKNVIRRTP